MEDIKQIQEFFSKPLEEGKQLNLSDFNKVVKAVEQTGHPVTVLLTPKFNEIEVLTGMNAPDDMLRDLSNTVDSLGYGRNDIIIAADSSNLSRREYSDIFRVNGGAKDYFEESVNEMDMNDPVLMKMRAAKDKLAKMRAANAGDDGNDEFFDNAKKIAFLKKERAQLMRDMEQEAEPEGGPIANEYGNKLNRIDAAIAKLSGRKEMTYDQAIAEDKGKMPTQDQVDKFFALTQNETHYLNSKPVAGQEATFNLMKIEPWDEYDLSNWNSLVRKAKTRGKSIDENDKASIIKDKIEKLRKLSNSGEIDGDEFLDKFNPLQKQLKSLDEASRARVSMPRFKKDKNNPNFLNVYIDYDLGPGGASMAFGKETMTGQIRRESAAEAMRLASDVARDLEAEYDLEDIDIQDLENGKVRIFAVSDDFIDMNPNMLGEASKGAMNYFSDLKYNYQKAFRYLDVEEREEYKRLAKDFFSKLQVDDKVRAVGLEEAKVEVDDTTQFKLDLKHLLDKHIVKEASKEEENEFHKELDKLVHKTFGHSSDEKKKIKEDKSVSEGFFDRFKSKSNPKNATDQVKDPKGVKTDKKVKVQGKNVELWVDKENQPYINYEDKFIYVQSPGLEVKYADYKQPEPSTDSKEKTDAPTTFTWRGDDLKSTSKPIGPEYELTGKFYTYKDKPYPVNIDKKTKREYFQHEDGRVLDIQFVEKNTFKPFKKKVSETLAETIKLGEDVIEEELCPKGKAYIKRRKAAGEKSSAYLSGRAVKVCKGQMSGRKKRKSKKK